MEAETTDIVASTENRAVAKPQVQAGGKISAMVPTDIDQAYRLAQAIAGSGMAPKAYGTDANKVFVGIIAGAEIGLPPFQALQSIAVIGNNPAVWGDGALALVRASGLLVDIEESDDGNEATCRVIRANQKTPIIRKFSMDDAAKAGLKSKAGPWTQYPSRMRQMRARAWALRDGFPDVLKGLHIAEEVRDFPAIDGGAVRPAKLTTQMLAEQAGETIDVDEAGLEASSDPAPDTITEQSPNAEEGPADEQRGDAHDGTDEAECAATGDDTPAWQGFVDDIKSRIGRAKGVPDISSAMSDFAKQANALPDDVAADVNRLADEARQFFMQASEAQKS